MTTRQWTAAFADGPTAIHDRLTSWEKDGWRLHSVTPQMQGLMGPSGVMLIAYKDEQISSEQSLDLLKQLSDQVRLYLVNRDPLTLSQALEKGALAASTLAADDPRQRGVAALMGLLKENSHE